MAVGTIKSSVHLINHISFLIANSGFMQLVPFINIIERPSMSLILDAGLVCCPVCLIRSLEGYAGWFIFLIKSNKTYEIL